MNIVPKIALVGCGYWGKNLCRNFHSLGALSAVIDATESGQAIARSIAPDVNISLSFADVLSDEQIQGIALATPAETHPELAIQAMRAGKDVFVEKPMALSISDARTMQSLGNETGRYPYGGAFIGIPSAVLKLRELIDSAELGKINYIYSNRLNFGKVRVEENALWSLLLMMWPSFSV